MGKAEGREENWHGHVTAVTVAPQYRRLKLAAKMMKGLEEISERFICHSYASCHIQIRPIILFFYSKQCYFVDLFVRVSNSVATKMYTNLGYVVYRRILDYYSGAQDEDAFGKPFYSDYSVDAIWRIILVISRFSEF